MDDRTEYDALLYRRQFLAGPRRVQAPAPGWRSETFGSQWHFVTHPDLSVTKVEAEGKEILCLGHMLDPGNVERDNREVLRNLMASSSTFEEFERAMWDMGGRWLAFVRFGAESRLYLDACGLKPAFYTQLDRELWIGSVPKLLADVLGIADDHETLESCSSHPFANSWPGEVTPYVGVRQLLPNHFLDLSCGSSVRFWPVCPLPLPRYGIDKAAQRMGNMLTNLLESASRRAALALGLTAGYDSRVILACAQNVGADIEYFWITDPATNYHDVYVPGRLVRRLGVDGRVIHSSPLDDNLRELYRRNSSYMFQDPGCIKLRGWAEFADRWIITGNAAEVGRCFYYKEGHHPGHVDGEVLAERGSFKGNPVAIASFEKWLNDVPEGAGINTLDLFYWEHRLGNWCAMATTAMDTICETVPLYNNRRVLETALGVDVEYRKAPYELFRRICGLMAPMTLTVPFNDCWQDRLSAMVGKVVPWRVRNGIFRARLAMAGLRQFPTIL